MFNLSILVMHCWGVCGVVVVVEAEEVRWIIRLILRVGRPIVSLWVRGSDMRPMLHLPIPRLLVVVMVVLVVVVLP